MKQTIKFLLALSMILCVLPFYSCSKDDDDDEKSLVGTWICDNDDWRLTFKADGTGYDEEGYAEEGYEGGYYIETFTYTYDASTGILKIRYDDVDDDDDAVWTMRIKWLDNNHFSEDADGLKFSRIN